MNRPEIEDIYPLSPLQRGMLFHSVYDPDAGDYVVQLSAELADGIGATHFRQAWEAALRQHAILRTLFLWEGRETPLQLVLRQAKLPWAELDWTDVPAADRDHRLAELLDADRRRGFNLAQAPLLRVTIIHLAAARRHAVVSFHHILLDGWSFASLLEEIAENARALAGGRPPAFRPRQPFRNYIDWLGNQRRGDAEAYWREQLAGLTEPTLVATKRGTEGERPSYARLTMRLPADATAALGACGRARGLTLNTMVQGAWTLLLARHADTDEVIFGGTVSGRPPTLAGIDLTLGMFINTLPVRIAVAEGQHFGDWLGALQSAQLQAREYDHCALTDIQGWAGLPPGLPLFESILVFENFPSGGDADATRGIFRGDIRSFEQTAYPLTLTVQPGERLLIELDYSENHFDARTARQLLAGMETLLTTMPGAMERPVGQLDAVPPDERRQLAAWENGPAASLRIGNFSDAFARQARLTPEAVAYSAGDETLTYDELDRQANRLAHFLIARGAGPDRRVGVCLSRSLGLGIAAIAIMKAGAVYVPLDPNYPHERLNTYARDSRLKLLITDSANADIAPRIDGAILLDIDSGAISAMPERPAPVNSASERNLAYIVHTSGSTGRPKGVMVDNLGFANHCELLIDFFGIGPADTIAQTASTCFDISVWQLLTPLLAGARVAIIDDAVMQDPRSLTTALAREHISVLQIVPSLLRLLLDECERPEGRPFGPGLRWMCVTGEAVPPSLASRWKTTFPDIPLMNAYGPAECSDDVTFAVLGPADDARPASIGRPVRNARVHVLDRRLRPLPAGRQGELYVGGIGVGRGYFDDPVRTAEAFIPDPFATRPGERLYRSGDLVRWRADGELEFAGRRDHQIKLNGARIEAGELEAAIAAHPAVREALVELAAPDGGERRLIAFLTLDAESRHRGDALTSELRDVLRARLPRYMVPSGFIIVDAFPLLPNGKIDRQALRQQAHARRLPTPQARTARSPAVELACGLFTHVLKTGSIGPGDDFFERGGHSLLAMQLVSRARRAFDCALPVRLLFDAPTPEEFAAAIETFKRGADAAADTPIERVEPKGSFPVISAQRRFWRLMVDRPGTGLFNLPTALRLTGPLDIGALEAAIGDLLDRHTALRTRIHVVDGELVQTIDPAPASNLAHVDLEGHGPDAVAIARRVAREEAHWPFNPVVDHCFRCALLRLGEDDHVLLVTLNHILADDLSIGILLDDLTACYAARREGQPPPADMPVQFVDYAVWLAKWLDGEDSRRQEAFWTRTLANSRARLDLPGNAVSRDQPGFHFRRIRRRLPAALHQQLKALTQSAGATMFMTMMAAFEALLHRETEATDIRLGTLVSSRNRVEMERMIGPLIATVVMRTDLSGNPTFLELIGRVRQTALDVYANRDLPIDRVVAAAAPGRDLLKDPLFQILVIFQTLTDGTQRLGDAKVEPFDAAAAGEDELEISSYDLIFELEARSDTLDLIFRYNADLFGGGQMSRYLDAFEALLRRVAADPSQSIIALREEAKHFA